jgi:hypothetical protein
MVVTRCDSEVLLGSSNDVVVDADDDDDDVGNDDGGGDVDIKRGVPCGCLPSN